VAAGLHRPASDQLARFRAAIDDGRKAASFEKAVKAAADEGLTLTEPELKRAPRGYPEDHARIDRLRLKSATVSKRHPLGPWLHKPSADKLVRTQLDAARPLVKWLANHVGPSSKAA
jgi:uncharacterized protein (DUF2461 family)